MSGGERHSDATTKSRVEAELTIGVSDHRLQKQLKTPLYYISPENIEIWGLEIALHHVVLRALFRLSPPPTKLSIPDTNLNAAFHGNTSDLLIPVSLLS